MFKFTWIKKILSDSDDASSTRLIGLTTFAVFIYIILYSIRNSNAVNVEILSVALEYLFYTLCATLFVKSIEKIVKLIKTLKSVKKKENESSDEPLE